MSADLISPTRSALVLVDYQQRLVPLIDRGEQVVAHALRLADAARALGVPVIGTEQNPAGLGPNLDAVRQRCASTILKMHFDACEDGLLGAMEGHDEVVIAGCEAHVCLMQTALGLLRNGRRVWVVAPACGSRSASDHTLAMQRLHSAGATLVSSEMVVFEWLRSCQHEHFKTVLPLVKTRID
jgi:nicotinamidase-related amidase